MVQTIIAAYPSEKHIARNDGSPVLNIAECFARTIQGENLTGNPSTFVRLQYCTLDCGWCDSSEVWRQGNPYSIRELVELFEANNVLKDLENGHHLIYTGGSPVKQQDALVELTECLTGRIGRKPVIEVENECTIMPTAEFADCVDIWNNSPKLANSGMQEKHRIRPRVLRWLARQPNSFWKFVVTCKKEWDEIVECFLSPYGIPLSKVVLMPEGQTREELKEHYQAVVDICCENGVRMTDRLHITIWGKTVGV